MRDWVGKKNRRIIPSYVCRFIPDALAGELINLYHLARTATSGNRQQRGRHAQMIWAAEMFYRAHPDRGFTVTGAYKDLDGLLSAEKGGWT